MYSTILLTQNRIIKRKSNDLTIVDTMFLYCLFKNTTKQSYIQNRYQNIFYSDMKII